MNQSIIDTQKNIHKYKLLENEARDSLLLKLIFR